MISDDLETELGADEGIVWRMDGRAVVRVRVRRDADHGPGEWVERLAREAAERWSHAQTAQIERYEVAVLLADGAWRGVTVISHRAPATLRSVRAARFPTVNDRHLNEELARVRELRRG